MKAGVCYEWMLYPPIGSRCSPLPPAATVEAKIWEPRKGTETDAQRIRSPLLQDI